MSACGKVQKKNPLAAYAADELDANVHEHVGSLVRGKISIWHATRELQSGQILRNAGVVIHDEARGENPPGDERKNVFLFMLMWKICIQDVQWVFFIYFYFLNVALEFSVCCDEVGMFCLTR